MYYEKLLAEYPDIKVMEKELKFGFKGLYRNGAIVIDKRLNTVEKGCILAEELGHHHKTVGNILDQSKVNNVKQEKVAREWAFNKLLPLSCFVEAFYHGCTNRYEIANFLDVTEEFFQETINRYIEKYGDYIVHNNLLILLNPLNIIEKKEKTHGYISQI